MGTRKQRTSSERVSHDAPMSTPGTAAAADKSDACAPNGASVGKPVTAAAAAMAGRETTVLRQVELESWRLDLEDRELALRQEREALAAEQLRVREEAAEAARQMELARALLAESERRARDVEAHETAIAGMRGRHAASERVQGVVSAANPHRGAEDATGADAAAAATKGQHQGHTPRQVSPQLLVLVRSLQSQVHALRGELKALRKACTASVAAVPTMARQVQPTARVPGGGTSDAPAAANDDLPGVMGALAQLTLPSPRLSELRQREEALRRQEAALRANEEELQRLSLRIREALRGMVPMEMVEARERNAQHRESALEAREQRLAEYTRQQQAQLERDRHAAQSQYREEAQRFAAQCQAERHQLEQQLRQERARSTESIERQRIQLQARLQQYQTAAEQEATEFALLLQQSMAEGGAELAAARAALQHLQAVFGQALHTLEAAAQRASRAQAE
eukprot:ctg_1325.g433